MVKEVFGCNSKMAVYLATQIHEEKLLYWNMAVRDFSILINLIKVSMERLPVPSHWLTAETAKGPDFQNGPSQLLPTLCWAPVSPSCPCALPILDNTIPASCAVSFPSLPSS